MPTGYKLASGEHVTTKAALATNTKRVKSRTVSETSRSLANKNNVFADQFDISLLSAAHIQATDDCIGLANSAFLGLFAKISLLNVRQ